MASPLREFNLFAWIRNSFLAGVALFLPFLVTVWVIWLVVSFIDSNVVPFLPPSMQPVAAAVPGAGVAIALIGLTVIGALAGNLLGRLLVGAADGFIGNLPIVRSIYGGAKQVFGQVATPERTTFREAVLVEFPLPGTWAIGFVTNDDATEVGGDPAEQMVCVFVPHTPIPASGFLLYLPRAKLRPLKLSAEEALKRVISLGIIRDDEGSKSG
ncbi:MAG TPA: DUF502 domain-containing protein [Caulobacterales bacterium]|nr:DUF502 domain-containing protein [Caulobacterales bacterium]